MGPSCLPKGWGSSPGRLAVMTSGVACIAQDAPRRGVPSQRALKTPPMGGSAVLPGTLCQRPWWRRSQPEWPEPPSVARHLFRAWPCLPGGFWGVPSSSGSTSPKHEREGFFRADVFPFEDILFSWQNSHSARTRHVSTSAAETSRPARRERVWAGHPQPTGSPGRPHFPQSTGLAGLRCPCLTLCGSGASRWPRHLSFGHCRRPDSQASARCGGAGGQGPLGPAGSSPCACGGRGRPGAS